MQTKHIRIGILVLLGMLELMACYPNVSSSPPATIVTRSRIAEPLPTTDTLQNTAPSDAKEPLDIDIQIDPGKHPGSWLYVKVDEETVLQRILQPGEALHYTALRTIWMKASNEAVIAVKINGAQQRLGKTPGGVVIFGCENSGTTKGSCAISKAN